MVELIKDNGSKIYRIKNIDFVDERIDVYECIDYKNDIWKDSSIKVYIPDVLKDAVFITFISTMQQNGQMDECGFLEDYKTWSDNTEYNYRIFAKHNEISNFVINYPLLYEKVKNNEKIPFGGGYYIMLRTIDEEDRMFLESMGIVIEDRL